MSHTDILRKQAHDIGFATFRVASLIRHKELRKEIESAAISLVREPNTENIDSLVGLIRLSISVREVGEVNGDTLKRELGVLRDAISSEFAGLPDEVKAVDLGGIFKRQDIERSPKKKKASPSVVGASSSYPQERRSAVYQFIRQLPDGCRMRDLTVQFPNVSERTLRGDVQKLVDGGSIERVGSKSGPFSYLRAVEVESDGSSSSGSSSEYVLLPEADPRVI